MKKALTLIMLILLGILNADLTENTRVDTMTTLDSFTALGGFHTIEYVGDYEYILDYMDNLFLGTEAPQFNQMGCSLFSGTGDTDNIFLGRNFDNPQQDALIGIYDASDSYRNIAISRISDTGIPTGTNYPNMSLSQKMNLLKSPYFACDGINEMGLSVGIAYVDAVPVQIDPNKESIWLTRWIREILDHAATIQEAIDITNTYNILDNLMGANSLCHHIIVNDVSGESVILEYHDGAFEAISPDNDWQVLTNTHIYNHTLQQMFNLCNRYQLLYNALEDQNGVIYDWQNGLDILELPTWGNLTNGTQWSSLYDLNEQQVYLSTYRDFNNIARIELDTFEILNFGEFYLEDVTIQDADGDGLIEPDEQVFVIPSVTADFKSLGVVGTISSDEPDMIYINDESIFGDIFPNEIVHNAVDPFIIQIPSNPSNTIFLNFEFTTSHGYSYLTNYPIQITNTNNDDILLNSTEITFSNYPNPFNPNTEIRFQISNFRNLVDFEIQIYNLKGQKVKQFSHAELVEPFDSMSNFSVNWNGTDNNLKPVSTGIYYAILKQNGNTLATRKMVMMK